MSRSCNGPVVAIGIFDGVHRGHQAILARAVRRARRLKTSPIALTFYPHPATIVAPQHTPRLLFSLEQRVQAFAACGIRRTVVLRFTKAFSRWTPEQFIERVLVRRLRAREVVVGHDFGFGRGRSGTIETLRQFGQQHGFRVHVVPPVRVGRIRVASRLIRRAIASGRLDFAWACLGRPPTVVGRVVRGAGRGKRIGVPTANLRVEAGVLPPPGVYAVWARVREDKDNGEDRGNRERGAGGARGRWVAGVANLGWRPTVTRHRPLAPILEVHLLRRHAPPLRGRRLEVAFGKRLRSERRFSSMEALAAQIHRDQALARRWLRAGFRTWFRRQRPEAVPSRGRATKAYPDGRYVEERQRRRGPASGLAAETKVLKPALMSRHPG